MAAVVLADATSVPVSGALDVVVVAVAVAMAGAGAAVAIIPGAAVLAATADVAVGTAQPMLPEVDAPSSDFQRASDERWITGADSLSDRLCLKRRTGCGCCCRRLGRTVPQSARHVQGGRTSFHDPQLSRLHTSGGFLLGENLSPASVSTGTSTL